MARQAWFVFLIIAAGYLCRAGSAGAAELTCAGEKLLKPEAAKGVLAAVQQAYGGITTMQGEFSQRSYLAAIDLAEESSGEVFFKKPGKMKWHYRQPEEQIFTTVGRTVYLYQQAENQLIVDALTEVVLSELPVAFLLGVGNLEKDFQLEQACTRSSGATLLTLLPKEKSDKEEGAVGRFLLLVDAAKHHPLGAQVTDVGGNVTTIMLSRISLNQPVAENVFEMKTPPGTDVIDRRKGAGD